MHSSESTNEHANQESTTSGCCNRSRCVHPEGSSQIAVTLLIRGDGVIILPPYQVIILHLNLNLDLVNGVCRVERKEQFAYVYDDQVKSGMILYLIITPRASILNLFPRKDKTLSIGGDVLLILDLGLDVGNSIRRHEKVMVLSTTVFTKIWQMKRTMSDTSVAAR